PTFTTCEVTITKLTKVTATFDFATYPLTVVKKGSGEGTVTSNPIGINCGSECSHEFKVGTKVKLSQVPKEDSEFLGWGGVCSGTSTCEATMSEAKEATATFGALPQAIVKPTHPVSYAEATLHGEVQTAELETEYRFDYLTKAEYEEDESFGCAQ